MAGSATECLGWTIVWSSETVGMRPCRTRLDDSDSLPEAVTPFRVADLKSSNRKREDTRPQFHQKVEQAQSSNDKFRVPVNPVRDKARRASR